jgi:sugar O-acyltransferase (sialic acid O-acetyltransferase NeuD family)
MILVGAKGFAKEVFEIVFKNKQSESIVFYDDINLNGTQTIFEDYLVLQSIEEAKDYFEKKDNRFTIGVGNPILRKKMFDKFTQIGGIPTSTISVDAKIGSKEVIVGVGTTILDGAIISNSVTIGTGCILYYNAILTHDCKVGDFVEISPAAILLGRCTVGSYTQIGANSTILPDITIGSNVIVGAGAIVTKNVPDNCVVYGNPAKIIRYLDPVNI